MGQRGRWLRRGIRIALALAVLALVAATPGSTVATAAGPAPDPARERAERWDLRVSAAIAALPALGFLATLIVERA